MKLRITVHGVAYEVEVEVLDPGQGFPAGSPLPPPPPGPAAGPPRGTSPTPPAPRPGPEPGAGPPADAGSVRSVASPIAGTVVELRCAPGDSVASGQTVVVIEAMKMKTSIVAPAAGIVRAVPVAVGDTVREGETLVEFA